MLCSHIFILLYRASTLFLSIKISAMKIFGLNCNKSIAQRIALKKLQKTWSYVRKFAFTLYYTFVIIFALCLLVFKRWLLRVSYTFMKIQPEKMLIQVRKFQFNQKRMKILKRLIHIENWRQSVIYEGKVSKHTYFYIKEEGGRIDGSILSTTSPIPAVDLKYH